MALPWTPDQLQAIAAARELEITTARRDGTLREWVPIWVVVAGEEVYVRTWFRRETGWFGHAVGSGRARLRVPGVEEDVEVEDIGDADSALRAAVDEAYAEKYGTPGGDSGRMTDDEAAATSLRLSPLPPA